MSVRLFVGNLDYSVNEAELRQHFGEVGAPAQVALPVDRETGRPRGFAFVEFADRAVAEEVIRRFNGQALKGRPLAISEARAREDRPPMSGPRPPFSGGPPMGGPPRAPRGFDGPPGGGGGGGGFGAPAGAGGGPGMRDRRPAKAKAKPERPGPRGPIRERSGGRVMDIEDMGGADVDIDFDDPATSKAGEDDAPDEPVTTRPGGGDGPDDGPDDASDDDA
ncbi:MAG: RNA-binding protein [Vicinamibacteraceae bacterium]